MVSRLARRSRGVEGGQAPSQTDDVILLTTGVAAQRGGWTRPPISLGLGSSRESVRYVVLPTQLRGIAHARIPAVRERMRKLGANLNDSRGAEARPRDLCCVVPSSLPSLKLGRKRCFTEGKIDIQAAQMPAQHDGLRCRRVGKRGQSWSHACQRARADQRGVAWSVARQFGVGTLTAWCSTLARCQIDVQADFVNHHKVARGDLGDAQSEGCTCPLVALTGDQALFFRDHPKRRMARPSVHGLSVVAWSAFQRWACSAKVASGNWSSWKRSVAIWAAEMLAVLPLRGRGASEPLVWRILNQRLMLPRLT